MPWTVLELKNLGHSMKPFEIDCGGFSGTPLGTASGSSRNGLRRAPALGLALFLLLSGCQLTEQKEEQVPTSPQTPEQLDSLAASELPVEPSLSAVIEYLEAGKTDAAREMITVLADAAPASQLLARLLRQIDAPIEELLPGPYRRIRVADGESLSLIAGRELGDPLKFYALARLNDIEVPSRIAVGTEIRVPASPAREEADGPVDDAQTEITASEIESVAEYLVRSGQGNQARRMLIDRMQADDVPESTRSMLVALTVERATTLRAAGEAERALAIIDETLSIVSGPSRPPELSEIRGRVQSDLLVRTAERLRERNEFLQAHDTALQAVQSDPSSSRANTLVGEIRSDLVASLHNQALVAWRDRDVDLAIRTWESLLDAVPDFEPAQVYLERARRLRARLAQP